TPGHTPGSMCFNIEGSPVLLAGDTLFPGGPGNTTFEGGDFPTIIRSIEDRIFTLPPDTIVMPGHGDDTTIGTERPHLQEWIDRGWWSVRPAPPPAPRRTARGRHPGPHRWPPRHAPARPQHPGSGVDRSAVRTDAPGDDIGGVEAHYKRRI